MTPEPTSFAVLIEYKTKKLLVSLPLDYSNALEIIRTTVGLGPHARITLERDLLGQIGWVTITTTAWDHDLRQSDRDGRMHLYRVAGEPAQSSRDNNRPAASRSITLELWTMSRPTVKHDARLG